MGKSSRAKTQSAIAQTTEATGARQARQAQPCYVNVESLTKRFGATQVIHGISLQANKGDVLGFLGPNGAGKTTTMRMITGFLQPTSGMVQVCEADPVEDPITVKRHIGYLPEGSPLYPDMTPRQLLKFVAGVREMDRKTRNTRLDFVVERLGLEKVLDQSIETLSKGFKRRVGLAQAILHDPDVLILDEPTDGLDPLQKREVRDLIREIAANKAIIISTHILEEVEAICNRTVIIGNGKLLANNTPTELRARDPDHNTIRMLPAGVDLSEAVRTLSSLRNVALVRRERVNGQEMLRITPTGGKVIAPDVGTVVKENDWQVNHMEVLTGDLEHVFNTIVTEEKVGRS